MTESTKSSKTPKRNGSWWRKNWFYTVLIAVAVIGGLSAFGLPLIVSQPFSAGDSISTLRQAILAATGGVLAILTLWENRRKNIQEKDKNDQDHTRQVHAERRARYAKAIEQLADDKSAIRLGGVYTLAKLVDDWLDDEKTLRSMEKRRQEGQIIIDSLCAYIRSSFPLAERHDELTLSYEEYQQKYQDKNQVTQSVENSVDNSTPKPEEHQDNKQSREEFLRDKSIFREEQEVRQTILAEIEKRLNSNKDKNEDGKGEVKPGTWSYFEYDFSNTLFFYCVDFNDSYFGASSKFAQTAFMSNTDFSKTRFIKEANFFGTTFTMGAKFSKAVFNGKADFSKSTFCEDGNFSQVTFNMYSSFDYANFNMFARFYKAFFTGDASFIMMNFNLDTYFSGATFTNHTSFLKATFHIQPIFASILHPWEGLYIAKFSSKGKHNFNTSSDSPYKIETEEKEYNGTKFTIPKGAILFDPDEPSEQEDNDDN